MTLEEVLAKRAMAEPTTPPAPIVEEGLVSPPPTPKDRLPTAFERWLTAEKMKAGYRNGWQPNPIILKHSEGLK